MTTPDNALIDSMPELDIDTAGHTGMRIRGYSVERVKVLLDRIASLEAEKVQLMKRIHEAADLAEGDAAVIELLERENADLKARLSQAQAVPMINEVWDARLGRVAMRFVDRAGDVHPGIDDARQCTDCNGTGHVSKGSTTQKPDVPTELLEHMRRAWWDFHNDTSNVKD